MQTATGFQFRVPDLEVVTVRRKAAVVEAVRGCWIPIEEICEIYSISVDEFLAWERDLDRYGIHGLRTTRYQIYRDTDKRTLTESERSCEAGGVQLLR